MPFWIKEGTDPHELVEAARGTEGKRANEQMRSQVGGGCVITNALYQHYRSGHRSGERKSFGAGL